MVNIFEGHNKVNKNTKIGIVVSKFNEFVTEKLLSGCIESLEKNGIETNNIDVLKVPGAFEIPTAAKKLINENKYNGIVCLGAVIRGETPHFDYICSSVSSEIAKLGVEFCIPVIFGVITTDSIDQALDRAGGKVGNKGSESAIAVLEMIEAFNKIQSKIKL